MEEAILLRSESCSLMIDSKKRALTKSLSWRLIAALVLGTITWLTTGDIKAVGIITIIYNLVQVLLFFLHERFWNYIPWGRTKGVFIQMTGMSGAGKTTISKLAAKKLKTKGIQVELIDGDEFRQNVTRDLGFSKEDRLENISRLGFIGKILSRNSVVAIMAAINPYQEARNKLAQMGAKTVYVKCDLKTLKFRDPKGLYYRAIQLPDGHPEKIHNFTGVSDPFEAPDNPDLVLETEYEDAAQSANKLVTFIEKELNG